jgi:hypothetical protein
LPFIYLTSPHFIFSLLLFHHNNSTQTANSSKMAGRLFAYCKELVGVYPDSTESDTETDTDSSTRSTDSPDATVAADIKPDDNKTITTAYTKDDIDALVKHDSLDIASGIEPYTADKAASHARYLAELARLKAELATAETNLAEANVADSPEAKVADSSDAKAATDVKPDDNGTAATVANNDDAKVEQVNLDIASESQQENTTQADIEAWHVAELARLEAKLATSDARLIGLAADLAWADCLIFKKEQEHLRLHGKLSSLHEAYSKRHEELTKQNQELERVVEESQPGAAADMALLLLYLSCAAVDIAGTAKQDAEKFLRRADQQWEAYKRGYPLDDEGDTSDAEGAE